MVRTALLVLALLGGCVMVEKESEYYPEFNGARMRQWWFAHRPLIDWSMPRP